MEGARNRKQRRAAAAAAAKPPRPTDAFDPASVPLAHPPSTFTNPPTGKTLVDIIAERQGELLGQLATPTGNTGTGTQTQTQFVTVDPRTGEISALDEGSLSRETKRKAMKRAEKARRRQQQQQAGDTDGISGEEDEEDEEDDEEEEELEHPIPPVIDTLLLAVPLTTLHLTLAYLAAHQYAQEIELEKLVRESVFVALPMLALLIHLAHGHVVSFIGAAGNKETLSLLPWDREKRSWAFLRRLLFPPSLRTVVFLPLTAFLGCRLMVMTNEDPYYAVMKQAPAFGTMWIWGVLEMSFGPAVLGALGPLIWGVWWMGYGIL